MSALFVPEQKSRKRRNTSMGNEFCRLGSLSIYAENYSAFPVLLPSLGPGNPRRDDGISNRYAKGDPAKTAQNAELNSYAEVSKTPLGSNRAHSRLGIWHSRSHLYHFGSPRHALSIIILRSKMMPYLLAIESPIREKPHLARALPRIHRPPCPEALAPYPGDAIEPYLFVTGQIRHHFASQDDD